VTSQEVEVEPRSTVRASEPAEDETEESSHVVAETNNAKVKRKKMLEKSMVSKMALVFESLEIEEIARARASSAVTNLSMLVKDWKDEMRLYKSATNPLVNSIQSFPFTLSMTFYSIAA
jgi:hypothetical protein